jgi:hypothetical protein
MKFSAASNKRVFRNYFLFSTIGWELNPLEIKYGIVLRLTGVIIYPLGLRKNLKFRM